MRKVLCLLLFPILSACSSSTSTAPDLARPGIGTWFAVQNSKTDTAGLTYDVSSASAQIVQTHANWGGKSDVYVWQSFDSATGKIGYAHFAYDPSGDFAIGDSTSKGISWDTIPLQVGHVNTKTLIDTVYAAGGSEKHQTISSVVGTEQLTILATTVSAIHLRSDEEYLHRSTSETDSNSYITNSWFIPQLGYFGKMESAEHNVVTGPHAQDHTTTSSMTLTGMTLK